MTDTKESNDERRDLLLSAAMDDELSADEREELATWRARGETQTTNRERAFLRIDEGLRAMAAESIDDARLAASRTNLDARLAAHEPRESAGFSFGTKRLALGLAAAASLVLYSTLPRSQPPTDASGSSAALGQEELAFDALEDPAGSEEDVTGEDLALAIGYGDENSEIGVIMGGDFEVIEQLDLLDYLLTLDQEERG